MALSWRIASFSRRRAISAAHNALMAAHPLREGSASGDAATGALVIVLIMISIGIALFAYGPGSFGIASGDPWLSLDIARRAREYVHRSVDCRGGRRATTGFEKPANSLARSVCGTARPRRRSARRLGPPSGPAARAAFRPAFRGAAAEDVSPLVPS